MKRVDDEFIRDYYSYFTIEYERVVERLFDTRVFLIASAALNVLLIIALCVMLAGCAAVDKTSLDCDHTAGHNDVICQYWV
jgi:hypothetical protein